jgi:hypothetical protein
VLHALAGLRKSDIRVQIASVNFLNKLISGIASRTPTIET